MPRCFLALGGNIGDVEQTFAAVLADLGEPARHGVTNEYVRVVRVSRFFRTSPIGADAGGEFLNTAVEIETDLSPHGLLDLTQSIEAAQGRSAGARWGPRPIDVDLILYGDEVIDDERLTVPHPACWYRRFVLDPLVEIAADVVHPIKGITVGELQARLLLRPFRLGLAGGDERLRSRLVRTLREDFPQMAIDEWPRMGGRSNDQATIIAWLGPGDVAADELVHWEALPKIPRLDVSHVLDQADAFLADVLRSATDEPQLVEP